ARASVLTGASTGTLRDSPPRGHNLKDFDRVSDLTSIKIPTLLLCGEFDECTPETTRDYASKIPRSEFAEIKGSAHLTTIDAPRARLNVVRSYLSRVERG